MLSLETEKQNLAKADRDIAEGERRIAEQTVLLNKMSKSGMGDLSSAQQLLTSLKQTLQTWKDHRAIILETIAAIEGGALPIGGRAPQKQTN